MIWELLRPGAMDLVNTNSETFTSEQQCVPAGGNNASILGCGALWEEITENPDHPAFSSWMLDEGSEFALDWSEGCEWVCDTPENDGDGSCEQYIWGTGHHKGCMDMAIGIASGTVACQ